jgi:hypothetical protein
VKTPCADVDLSLHDPVLYGWALSRLHDAKAKMDRFVPPVALEMVGAPENLPYQPFGQKASWILTCFSFCLF